MCGIAGIWSFDEPVQPSDINRLVDALAHRGPDGRGVWLDVDGRVALGHRRLSILDTSTLGQQPMSYAEGRYQIVYNGEIFNFLELQSQLRDCGHEFRSHSDTEVLLAAYAQWGADMLPRLNGMWALAVFDRKRRELFLARDRFGIKPLHYSLSPRQFAFASELKAFRKLRNYSPEIDLETERVFLQSSFGVEGSDRTLLLNVRRLPGGHHAVVQEGRVTVTRWWKTADHLVETPSDIKLQAAQFRELFYDAVKLRMRSDVAIGTCLSGGFDSTAVSCAMSDVAAQRGERQAPEWHKAFVASMPGALNDETPQAREAIAFAGLQGNILPIADSDALPMLEKVLFDMDDLFIGSVTVPWMIYRHVRECGVVVSIDGHGADELMGAYKTPDYFILGAAPHWLSRPLANVRRIGESIEALPAAIRPVGVRAKAQYVARSQLAFHRDFAAVKHLARGLRRRLRLTEFGGGGQFLRASASAPVSLPLVGAGDELPSGWGPVNRELYTMFHSTVLPTILRNFDRLSMAHGVEIRMPFMDWRLVTYVMSLPDDSKIGDQQTKRIAREAMRGLMPETIRASRQKIGFGSPMPEWLNGPLRDWTASLVDDPSSLQHPLLDGRRLQAFVHKKNAERSWTWNNYYVAWTCLHALWYERRFLHA